MSESGLSPADILNTVLMAHQTPERGRVFTLMGPNGAGKTRLLRELERLCREQGRLTLFLPAIRDISVSLETPAPPSVQGPMTLANALRDSAVFHRGLAWSVDSRFRSMQPREDAFKEHLYQHVKTASPGELPKPPSDEVLALKKVIEETLGNGMQVVLSPSKAAQTLEISTEPQIAQPRGANRNVQQQVGPQILPRTLQVPGFQFTRNEVGFDTGGLSDGEKQILNLAWMLNDNESTSFVFFVDEPELYLNEARAIEFWGKLESALPHAVFFYATHNVVFATRPGVTQTYLMGMDQKLEILNQDEPLPRNIVRDIVGARVQILRTSKPIIFCEDTMLRHIADDLLPKGSFELVILEGHESVCDAVKSDNKAWSRIRSAANFCGIIDRDTRTDEDVNRLADKKVFAFPYFESESVLAHPNMATLLLSRRAQREVTSDEYVPALIEAATESINVTLNKLKAQISRRGFVKLDYEFHDGSLTNITAVPPPDIKTLFKDRAEGILQDVCSGEPERILIACAGYQLCAHLSEKSGVKFGAAFGSHPEADYEQLRTFDQFQERFRSLRALSKWGQKITKTLIS